jgi:hypothetical protein
MNVGEEICGEWLRHVKGCEFVQYNVQTVQTQGEIDVIGINLNEHTVYACEVAVHLVTGLLYVKDNKSDNVPSLTKKFRKDIGYIRATFPDYNHIVMLWSPVVNNEKEGSKYNGLRDIRDIISAVEVEHGVTVEAVINQRYQAALDELRDVAGKETKALDSSVMRYLQVEEHLQKHICRLDTRQADPEK